LGEKLAEPAQHIWWLILIPILSLFFLKDGLSIANGMIDLGRTPEEKKTIRGIVGDINVMLGSYIRAQLILASLTVVSYTLVLSLMRVPYAFILGPLAGLFEFVPVVGPALSSVIVFVIAILTSYPHMIWLFLFLGLWRLVQDYVNAPRIMGKSLEISPLVQIFGVLSGGEIAGVVGALISVPAIAILRILWRRLTSDRSADAPVTRARSQGAT
jgi:predicted PurR-regulated permease PerM